MSNRYNSSTPQAATINAPKAEALIEAIAAIYGTDDLPVTLLISILSSIEREKNAE